jgi:leader peptidase (prepilin peptidase)/N-methyltransferase
MHWGDICQLFSAAEIREPPIPLWALELTLDVFVGAWLFFVGASLGSFLNVVVYRLPRGLNLVHPPSRCSSCLHPIRFWDNVPILSWLVLRGKCRDCRAPVSSRYFWIELLMGSVFLAVWLGEVNFTRDLAAPASYFGRQAIGPHQTIPFWLAYATHVLLIATLLGGMLISADGSRVPWTLYVPVLMVAMVLPLIYPEIRRVPAWQYEQVNHWQAGLIDGLLGLGLGAAIAIVGSCWRLWAKKPWPTFAPVALMASLGAVFGWQRLAILNPFILIFYLVGAGVVRGFGRSPAEDRSPDEPQPQVPLSDESPDDFSSLPCDLSHEPNQPARRDAPLSELPPGGE